MKFVTVTSPTSETIVNLSAVGSVILRGKQLTIRYSGSPVPDVWDFGDAADARGVYEHIVKHFRENEE